MKYEDYITHLNETCTLIDDIQLRTYDTLQEITRIIPKGMGAKTKQWNDVFEKIIGVMSSGLYRLQREIYRVRREARLKHNGREMPF